MPQNKTESNAAKLGTESIFKLLLRMAPPIMLSDFILAMYNICDSGFVGHFSTAGLTALSIIMPVQFLAISLGLGTGISVNTLMAKLYAEKRFKDAQNTAGVGCFLALIEWIFYSLGIWLFLPAYARACANSPESIQATLTYGRIVCYGSLPMFLDCVWSRVHQAEGNMMRTMYSQVSGALINILLDGPMIFGWWIFPSWGVAGAAIATVIGQTVSACITFKGGYFPLPPFKNISSIVVSIMHYAYSQILRLGSMTFYIVLLNIILARFSDAAITVLGLYYRMQSFIFIPLCAFNNCIIPILSYNYTRRYYERCKTVMTDAVLASAAFALIGVIMFEFTPGAVLSIFSNSPEVHEIGIPAFRIIGLSLVPAVFSLISPIFFQAIGWSGTGLFLSLLRQIFTLLPIFWLLSLLGLGYTWLAFPLAESITGYTGYRLYLRQIKHWH